MATKIVEIKVNKKLHSCDTCGVSEQIVDGKVIGNPSNRITRCSVCGADMCNNCLINKGACVYEEDTPILCPACVKKGLKIKAERQDEDYVGHCVIDINKKPVETPYW